jgi:hypothetical protein
MREDWVTTGSSEGDSPGASIGACASAGVSGGAGGGVCANATELNASPRVVIRSEDEMFMGETSGPTKARGSPFTQPIKTPYMHTSPFQNPSGRTLPLVRKPLNPCTDCGQVKLILAFLTGI